MGRYVSKEKSSFDFASSRTKGRAAVSASRETLRQFSQETVTLRARRKDVKSNNSIVLVSKPYAAEIRTGRRCPHPRHCQVLALGDDSPALYVAVDFSCLRASGRFIRAPCKSGGAHAAHMDRPLRGRR